MMSKISCVALVTLCCVLAAGISVAATVKTQYLPYVAGQRIRPFSNLKTTNYALLDGATVSIEFGFVPGKDLLLLDYEGEFDLKTTFSDGVLYIEGNAPASEYNVALSTVIFITTADDGQQRRITYSYGKNTIYASLTGHYYKYVKYAGSWSAAMQSCQTKWLGMQGYLATITSPDEMAEVGGKALYSIWVGGTDEAKDGTWKWATGPEAGWTFWEGQSMYKGGMSINNSFTKWYRFQPDNGNGDGQNYMSIKPSVVPTVSYMKDDANTDGVAGYVCEFGGMDSDAIAQTMSWYAQTVVLNFDCTQYNQDGPSCQNHKSFGCSWSGTGCSQIECTQYTDEMQCNQNWRCSWNTEGYIGQCGNTRCGKYLDGPTCSDDPTCYQKTVGGSSTCLNARCGHQASAALCAALDGCSWVGGQCAYDSSVNCDQQDIVYMLDGSDVMGDEWSRFSTGFQGLTDTFLMSQPALAPTASAFGQRIGFVQYGPITMQTKSAQVPPIGTGSGGKLATSWSAVQADLIHQQHRYAPSSGRTILSALQTAYDMLFPAGETTTRKKVLVIFAAGAIEDAQGVAGSTILANFNARGTKILGAAIRPSAQISNGATDAVASLQRITSSSMIAQMSINGVATQVIYGTCSKNSTLGKAVFAGTAEPRTICQMYPSSTSCDADIMCAWDDAAGSCRNTGCLKMATQSTCEAGNSVCRWDSSAALCKQKCPGTAQTSCTGSCTWSNGACVDSACVGNPNEDSCIADPSNCRYSNATMPACQPRTCEALTNQGSAACAASASNCIWVNNKECVENLCSAATTQGSCTASNCKWDTNTNACVFNDCGKHQSEMDCSTTTQCTWSVAYAPGACVPALCTMYNMVPTTAQSMCAMNKMCSWGGDQIRCQVTTCDMLNSSSACSTLSNCVWRNEQCKDSRYVQCPMIDAIFLVEGTKVMEKAFGRHPNGYYGIIEQIREWSMEAPFAKNAASTGFRVKLMTYGANTAQLYPKTGFYPKTLNDMPDPSQPSWTGAGGELYDAEGAQSNYANGAGSSVKIRPALLEAKKLFTAENASSRTQMVIVLGHSAITDGGDDLNTVIADLETNGIQIFSNVIRRFSSITPGEQRSADFLAPVASDPRETHFMFTTIDNMRKNLLDQFCDPSSGTGQALQISRDRTLPCNWLDGKTECEMQGSCYWNASALITCPLPNQCPNLGCTALPEALAKKFTCEHCKLVSGAFQCNSGNKIAAPPGLCMTSPCMMKNQASCTGSCAWNSDKQRCDRLQCNYADEASCNADLACVYVSSGIASPAGCRVSQCGLLRSSASCSALYSPEGATFFKTCKWMKGMAPAVCIEARCPNLDQTSCTNLPATCGWVPGSGRRCKELTCQYPNNARCEADPECFWNAFATGKNCQERTGTCVLSGYSSYSQCSATCGPAVQYKARTIVAFPDPGQDTCATVAATEGCLGGAVANCQTGDTKIIESKACTSAGTDCASHCATHGSNVLACTNDVSCQWKNRQCVPTPVVGCSDITNATACNMADICEWSDQTNYCNEVVKECKNATTEQLCGLQSVNCLWKTGSDAIGIANSMGMPSQIINPGQKEIFVFPTLRIESTDVISGATVTIEANYSRGKDLLELTYPTSITATWIAQSGTLRLSGTANVTDYANALRYVTFFTTSTSTAPRKITWSFRRNTIFSATTGHYYTAFWQSGISWDAAKTACSQDSFYGLKGYLATIQSAEENTLVSTKLAAEGWISGDDASRNQWRYSTGPDGGTPFWTGPSAVLGGYPMAGQYANWAQGQPLIVSNAGFNHPYLNLSGFWTAKHTGYASTGYICEYGGLIDDQPFTDYQIGGATLIGVGGCVPNMCTFHGSQSECSRDAECMWIRGSCKPGCSSLSSMTECERSAHCKWDTTALPATCDVNICNGLGETPCGANAHACIWTAGYGCQYRSGCAMYTGQENCSSVAACVWTTSTAQCETRPCNSFTSEIGCMQNALCEWNAGLKVCSSSICKYGVESQCTSDRRCTWSAASAIAAAFPPGGASILPFTSGVPVPVDTTTNIDGMTVSIVEGFQMGQDMLMVRSQDNIAGNYRITYSRDTGVMTLAVVPGVNVTRFAGFQFLKNNLRFYSTSNNLVRRRISFVLGLNMATGSDQATLFKYVQTATPATTQAQANQICLNVANNWGFTAASLAQIQSQTDNLRIKALGAQGWLGARVQINGGDNQWLWTSSPLNSAERPFWNGVGVRGEPFKTVNFTAYAQWAGGEPKRAVAGTYAFMAQTGFWKTIVENQQTIGQGVICQFAVPTTVTLTGERNVMPSGCYLTPCLSVPKAQCKESPQCVWVESDQGGRCAQDTWCTSATNPSACNTLELCFWDYSLGSCRTAPPNSCSLGNQTACNQNSGKCTWNNELVPRNPAANGVCTFQLCGVHPAQSPCTADPLCRWAASSDGLGGTCVSRLCGYLSESQCWTDSMCSWDRLAGRCGPSKCLKNDQTACSTADSCVWDATAQQCNFVRCGTKLTGAEGKITCQEDNMCLWNPSTSSCTKPTCDHVTESACTANPQCYFTFEPNRCLAAQCTSNTDLSSCEQGVTVLSRKPCIWEAKDEKCRQLTFAEQNAPVSSAGTCEKEEYGPLWWLWALAGLILLLIIGIFYRLYLAYSKGLSFFEPARSTKSFSPHEAARDILFEEAQQTAVETNVSGAKYARPTADEL